MFLKKYWGQNLEKLEEDLKIVEEQLEYLHDHQKNNFRVDDPFYLNPSFYNGRPLPMNHSLGSFIYFYRIKEVLEKALHDGYISEDSLPEDAPSYLEDFVNQGPYI